MPEKEIPIEEMEAWQVLQQAIPRGEAVNIAMMLDVSPTTVRSWRNDPDVDENRGHDPHGRSSPLAQFIRFITVVDARTPEGADFIDQWLEVQRARRRAQRGQGNLLAALEAAENLRKMAEEFIATSGGRRSKK